MATQSDFVRQFCWMKHHCNTCVKQLAKVLLCIVVFSREERHEFNVIHNILERQVISLPWSPDFSLNWQNSTCVMPDSPE